MLQPDRATHVRALFDSIAHRYDLLNHLLSAGMDFYWRRRAVRALAESEPQRILDVATGTGDLSIAAVRLGPQEIVGVDVATHMLARAQQKIRKKGLEGTIRLTEGAAEHLPFDDNAFDAAMVAFGARNFADLGSGLREMVRVIRKGGRVVVLEFSHPHVFPFRQLYFFYFKNILPLLGRLISGSREAYTYLPDTVMQFPEGEAFLQLFRNAGLEPVMQTRLTCGIASLYVGTKP
jgi:demethylmenaquinone methyltransferase / 2-methoxy-6-polyprenyl-1,4-benzoquinol methylase